MADPEGDPRLDHRLVPDGEGYTLLFNENSSTIPVWNYAKHMHVHPVHRSTKLYA